MLVLKVYNKDACDRDFIDIEMDRDKGNTPVVGQFFSKFMDYNDTVMTDVRRVTPALTSYWP